MLDLNFKFKSDEYGSILPDIAYALRPNPDITIAEHAEKNLYLIPGKNPFPGLVDFDRTPYLYEILSALMPDNGIEKVVLMKGWQTGGTLAGLAWMLWVMDAAPAPMLIVQPNDELRNKFSKQRISPIVSNCKSLQGKIEELERYSSKKEAKDTLITKQFPGGFLNLGTAKSEVSLRSDTVQFVMFDEVSAYDDDCQGHGDPCGIALGRTSHYDGRKKIFYISTPTIHGSCRIEEEYNFSDKRKYFIKCLSCGEPQIFEWKRFFFGEERVHYRCIKCEYKHYEEDKPELLKRGNASWQATANPVNPKSVGFHLPALYAPLGAWSWESSVEQFKKGKTNPQELKVFVNNVLGETWEDRNIKTIDPEDIMTLAEDYSFGPDDPLPQGIGAITAGVDTHPSHVDIVVRGWGRDLENWILDHVVIEGDSNKDEIWSQVYRVLSQTYTHHTGVKLRIAVTCVDTGGHNTEAVYNFCRGRLPEFILAIKGSRNPSAPVIGNSTKVKERTVDLFPVGKLATHGRLYSSINQSIDKAKEIKEALKNGNQLISYSGPQVMHFHKGLRESFYRQLTAPKAKWVRQEGQMIRTYVTTDHVADHAHDAMRYADAAFCFWAQDINSVCDDLDGRAQS
ncbi:phage terminase large subunit family protein [Pseudobacteriovorax antillogorgiicola]|uniref:Phage terminase, large subunit GpA n=1 Tax=Pseudobacteriovorax antillogorgiicola TaxID=1513793 RepID=A0A1Y6CNV9_9BACT|nr:terminase gpA endonuclease subunit [Pseudobacteriovorax antillogorgiicola]TCS44251.1 phage terminase large subunit GpA-like protein [Pseudobacteriovorax antillogorgiicola]SMF80748.1 Phage terminase, large subunit GpA [Pseudobacteriovorax antillogorgiicola]